MADDECRAAAVRDGRWMAGRDPLLPVGLERSGPSLTSLRGQEQAFDLRLKLTTDFVLPLN